MKTHIRRNTKRFKKWAKASVVVLAIEAWIDRLLMVLADILMRREDRTKRVHFIVAGPGQGSVGDQAMLEAFLTNVSGPKNIVVRSQRDLLGDSGGTNADLSTTALPNLLYGTPWNHFKDWLVLLSQLRSAQSLSVIGADVMDGAYHPHASVRRFRLAEMAGRLGIESRVLGFSWNDRPTKSAVQAMRKASKRSLLLARDPVSSLRLTGDGAQMVEEVADLAFLIQDNGPLPGNLGEWLDGERRSGRTIVGLNPNHGLQSRVDQVSAFVDLIQHGRQSGSSFVLLPHDSRGPASDEVLIEKIYQELPSREHVYICPHIMLPSRIAALCKGLDFVVTGRMHLAILASTALRPVVAFGYQGKVEGLYELLGYNALVSLDGGFKDNLAERFDRMLEEYIDIAHQLPMRLESLRMISRRNLVGL